MEEPQKKKKGRPGAFPITSAQWEAFEKWLKQKYNWRAEPGTDEFDSLFWLRKKELWAKVNSKSLVELEQRQPEAHKLSVMWNAAKTDLKLGPKVLTHLAKEFGCGPSEALNKFKELARDEPGIPEKPPPLPLQPAPAPLPNPDARRPGNTWFFDSLLKRMEVGG